jgi:hypothetical protein
LVLERVLQQNILTTRRKFMEYAEIRVPQFDGQNVLSYELWRNMMKSFLGAQGYDVWYSIVTRYTDSKKLKTASKKELKRNKKIEMNFMLEGLLDPLKTKVEQFPSTK